jgi:hypothetical protein
LKTWPLIITRIVYNKGFSKTESINLKTWPPIASSIKPWFFAESRFSKTESINLKTWPPIASSIKPWVFAESRFSKTESINLKT